MYKREAPLMILHDNPPPIPSISKPEEEEPEDEGGGAHERAHAGEGSPARLIFSLRDPVERAWSDFRFNYMGCVVACDGVGWGVSV